MFDRVDTMYQTFFGGRCDAMTQDASALAGAVATAAPNAADYVVLPIPSARSRSARSPATATRSGATSSPGCITAFSKPKSSASPQANVDEMAKSSSPSVQRLLGASGDLGSRLGLDNKWMQQVIKAAGNYGEIFERNVGKASPLKLERGLNATWTKGGLMYAIPFK